MKININTSKLQVPIILEQMSAKGGLIDIALKTAVSSLQGEILTRINERGEAADNSDIGFYSHRPLYVNPNNSPRKFIPEGKTGERFFRTGIKKGQQHKTKYFAGGYDEFKTAIGRNELGKVNLFLTGNMRDSFVMIETEAGWGLGWLNEETTKIALALETKYGKQIFSNITPEEKELLTEVIQKSLKQ